MNPKFNKKISWRLFLTGLIILIFHLAVFCFIGLNDNIKRADIIVIFGNTVNVDGTLSDRLKSRLDEGLELFNAGDADYILVTGGFGKEGHDEPQVMKQYLISKNVPRDSIFQDSQGANTLASAQNTKQIMTEKKLTSVILVSQYFHITRAVFTFKKIGVTEVYHAHAKIFELRDLYSLPREIAAFYKYLMSLN